MIFHEGTELKLCIHSVFESVNGEVCKQGQGSFTHFVRLAGCNLRCSYCDTTFAQLPSHGYAITIPELIPSLNVCPMVTITGGEPLLQSIPLEELCRELWFANYQISIETNGSIKIPKNWHVSWVVDYKLPSSGMNEHMVPAYKQWGRLHKSDFIKFVVYSKQDLVFALHLMNTVETKATFAISPVIGVDYAIPVLDIIKGVIESGILQKKKVILNHQLHKTLNLREPH